MPVQLGTSYGMVMTAASFGNVTATVATESMTPSCLRRTFIFCVSLSPAISQLCPTRFFRNCKSRSHHTAHPHLATAKARATLHTPLHLPRTPIIPISTVLLLLFFRNVAFPTHTTHTMDGTLMLYFLIGKVLMVPVIDC